MSRENGPSKYIKRGAAVALLAYLGTCTAFAFIHGSEDTAPSEQTTEYVAIPTDTELERGTDITMPMTLAVTGLSGLLIAGAVRNRLRSGMEPEPLPIGIHDALPFDPSTDLKFVQVTSELWQKYCPETGKFIK